MNKINENIDVYKNNNEKIKLVSNTGEMLQLINNFGNINFDEIEINQKNFNINIQGFCPNKLKNIKK